MRYLFSFCCYIIGFLQPDLVVIRHDYLQSAKHKSAAYRLSRELDSLELKDNPLLLGYKGASEIMKCKYACNPFSKITYFRKGKQLMEEAITREPQNTELHYLRYTIQTNAPDFLQYNKNIKDDELILLKYLSAKNRDDSELYGMVLNYLLISEKCAKTDENKLNNIKNNGL